MPVNSQNFLGEHEMRGFFRRRKNVMILVFSLILISAVALATLLPDIYVSRATLLVESQQLPGEYVKTSALALDEHVQSMTQQIMSRSQLVKIAEKYQLYDISDEKGSVESIVKKMRSDITIKPVSNEIIERKMWRPREGVVAFTLSYEGKNPEIAQKVVTDISSLYVMQSLKDTGERASSVKSFWQRELDQINYHINSLSGGIQALQERKISLESEIAAIDPTVPVSAGDGRTTSNPRHRLRYLRMELVRYKSTLTDKHPDVIKTKREIADLEARLGETDGLSADLAKLEQLKAEREKISASLGPNHPDVNRVSKEIEALAEKQMDSKLVLEKPDNPEYVKLKKQLAATDTKLRALTRDYESSKTRYNEVANKLAQARAAQGMEASEKDMSFTVVEPAQLPDKPEKPKRGLIVVAGLFFSLLAGLGIGAVMEGLDPSVKSIDEVQKITNLPVLSVIPYVMLKDERHSEEAEAGRPENNDAQTKPPDADRSTS